MASCANSNPALFGLLFLRGGSHAEELHLPGRGKRTRLGGPRPAWRLGRSWSTGSGVTARACGIFDGRRPSRRACRPGSTGPRPSSPRPTSTGARASAAGSTLAVFVMSAADGPSLRNVRINCRSAWSRKEHAEQPVPAVLHFDEVQGGLRTSLWHPWIRGSGDVFHVSHELVQGGIANKLCEIVPVGGSRGLGEAEHRLAPHEVVLAFVEAQGDVPGARRRTLAPYTCAPIKARRGLKRPYSFASPSRASVAASAYPTRPASCRCRLSKATAPGARHE